MGLFCARCYADASQVATLARQAAGTTDNTMPKYDDGVSQQGAYIHGRKAETTSEPQGIGKVSLIQRSSGPNASQPTEPNERTLTEQLGPVQRSTAYNAIQRAPGKPQQRAHVSFKIA